VPLGRYYFMHWVLCVCVCVCECECVRVLLGGRGGSTKQLSDEKDHTGNKKKLIKCVSETDKLRTIRRWRRKNNFRSVNGFFEEMKSVRCWGAGVWSMSKHGTVMQWWNMHFLTATKNRATFAQFASPPTSAKISLTLSFAISTPYMNHSFAVPANNIHFKGVICSVTVILNYSVGTRSGNSKLHARLEETTKVVAISVRTDYSLWTAPKLNDRLRKF